MNRRFLIAAVALLGAQTPAPTPAAAAIAVGPAHGFAPRQVVVKLSGERRARTVELPREASVRKAVAALRRSPTVRYAAPNYIATASIVDEVEVPNDPGALDAATPVPGGWVTKQWNFLPWQGKSRPMLPVSPGGIDAVGAWENLAGVGRPGALGVSVAVLDTGIAYRNKLPRFQRSPDFSRGQFAKGYDFVANDRAPLDQNGHGTHVAGTIGEKTNNGIGLTGLAFRARLMPVRVLDRFGRGRADQIAKGIRLAVKRRVDVINLSFNFGCGRRVPEVDEALRQAYRHGVIVVASVGNLGSEACVSPPATGPHVIGVGGSTAGGCLGAYSLAGRHVDLVAPGGGPSRPGCPSVLTDPIFQVTLLSRSTRQFGEPGDYIGTSMSAAHVSGVAALVLASGAVPRKRKPFRVRRVTRRLRSTARDLGAPKTLQGAGLIDAAAATAVAAKSSGR